MYASSACPSSMVVIIVELVTRSPTRTAMSPTVPGLRRDDAVELELDASLAHLGVERGETRLGRSQRVLRLVELGLADGAGLDQ